jgi:hypothetical protein
MRRGVYNDDLRAVLFSRAQGLGESRGLDRNYDWAFLRAAVVPALCTRLRIKINNDSGMTGRFGSNGKIKGKGGFASAPLLG